MQHSECTGSMRLSIVNKPYPTTGKKTIFKMKASAIEAIEKGDAYAYVFNHTSGKAFVGSYEEVVALKKRAAHQYGEDDSIANCFKTKEEEAMHSNTLIECWNNIGSYGFYHR